MSVGGDLRAHRESAGVNIADLVAATSIEAGVFLSVERGEAEPVAVEAFLRALLLVEEARGFANYGWAAETRRWLNGLEAAR